MGKRKKKKNKPSFVTVYVVSKQEMATVRDQVFGGKYYCVADDPDFILESQ